MAEKDDDAKAVKPQPKTDKPDYVKTSAEPVQAAVDENAEEVNKLRAENSAQAAVLLDKEAARNKANAEYEAEAAKARIATAKLAALIGTPARKPTTIREYAAQAKARGEGIVKVVVPKGFQHRLDDHQLIDVGPGVQQVPESLAKHWWFAANGVMAA